MVQRYVFSNNARSTLAEGISPTDTTLRLQTGDGAAFPVPDPTYDDVFSCVLFSADLSQFEIAYATARDEDTLTVERAQEGTTALTLPAGAVIVHTVTAGFFRQLITSPPSAPVLSGEYDVVYSEISLEWTASVPDGGDEISSYAIYRSVDGAAFSLLDTVAADILEYVDTDVDSSSHDTYSYYVVVSTELELTSQSNTETADVTEPLYVALPGGTGDVTPHGIYSRDGKNWTAFPIPAHRDWRGITYSPLLHLWVAVGDDPVHEGSVMTSPDGINWTMGTIPAVLSGWQDVIWVPDIQLFVAVGEGNGTTTDNIATSPDGFNWTKRDVGISVRGGSIKYIAGRLVVHGLGGVWGSSDFTTWVWEEEINGSGNHFLGGCVTEEPALYVTRVNPNTSIYRSTNGSTWSHYAQFSSYNILRHVAVNDDQSIVVLGAIEGSLYRANEVPPSGPDIPESWTKVFDPDLANHPNTLAWLSAHQIFLYLGTDYVGAWSEDGETWTPIDLPETSSWAAFGVGRSPVEE